MPKVQSILVEANGNFPLNFTWTPQGIAIVENVRTLFIRQHVGENIEEELDSLRYFRKLAELEIDTDLGGGSIKHITCCRRLRKLTLSMSVCKDVEILGECTNLETLRMNGMEISDISFLTNLVKLRVLFLDSRSNTISQWSPITNLVNLEELCISKTCSIDISALGSLVSLKKLDICGETSDYSFFEKLTKLEELNLPWKHSNQEFTPYLFSSLQILRFKKIHRLPSMFFVSSTLHTLKFTACHALSDLSPLGELVNLKVLCIDWFMNLLNISVLAKLTRLEQLFLLSDYDKTQKYKMDISPLGSLTRLQVVLIDGIVIKDLSPLGNCVELQELFLRKTYIRGISCLGTLKKLRLLDISETNVSNIKVLKSLTRLERLNICGGRSIEIPNELLLRKPNIKICIDPTRCLIAKYREKWLKGLMFSKIRLSVLDPVQRRKLAELGARRMNYLHYEF